VTVIVPAVAQILFHLLAIENQIIRLKMKSGFQAEGGTE
jgi:hypothetical protein